MWIDNNLGHVIDSGSGTVVMEQDGRTLILTCAHLFSEGVGTLTVTTTDGKQFPAKCLAVDKDKEDLAAVEITATGLRTFELATDVPKFGEKVYIAGFPHGQGLTPRSGEVDNEDVRAPNGKLVLPLRAYVYNGDSGAGVFNERAQLVGVIWGGNGDGTKRDIPLTCGAATPVKSARAFVDRVCFKFFGKKPTQPVNPGPGSGGNATNVINKFNQALVTINQQITQLQVTVGELQGRPAGKDGTNGKDGRDGANGKDGVSPDPAVVAQQVVSQLNVTIANKITEAMKASMTCVLQDENGNVLQQVQFGFNTPLVLRLKPVKPTSAPAKP